MKKTQTRIVDSPIGPLTLISEGDALTAIRFGAESGISPNEQSEILDCAAQQLEEYFSGRRRAFSVSIRPSGTPFQLSVWQALAGIPYGETVCYADIAVSIGNPKACRAVGMANNRNPLPIIVPCHRVVGKDGKLVGYAGGLETKEWLLKLEKQEF